MPEIATIIGGAGTGKTTHLMGLMDWWLQKDFMTALNIGFCSFTRAARFEAMSRACARFNLDAKELEKNGWFRTYHGCCYKLLGTTSASVISDSKKDRQWLQEVVGEPVRGTGGGEDDGSAIDLMENIAGRGGAETALALWDAARNRLCPFEEIWQRANYCDERTPAQDYCLDIISKYEQRKRLDNRLDYTDILGLYAGRQFSPLGHSDVSAQGGVPDLPVWFLDEAQDNSALSDLVARRLTSHAEHVYIVGDPFQCQPAGTPVLTRDGYKAIEDLDPESDFLIAMNPHESRFCGNTKRIPFQKAFRDVDSGDLVEITCADGTVHVSTANHRWFCRMIKKPLYATYLMKKGDRWRVGTVQMFASTKQCGGMDFRFTMRCHQEQADSGWILKVFDSDAKARQYEQIISCRYGLPQVTFRPVLKGCNLSQEFIDGVFAGLGDLSAKAVKCIEDHDLEVQFPFFVRGDRSKNGSQISRFLRACNIIAGVTHIPQLNREAFKDMRSDRVKGRYRTAECSANRTTARRLKWIEVTSVRRLPPGEKVRVYSLNVEKHHTYITKEFVTGNCIYGWSGASPAHFQSWVNKDRQRVLPKSYRCGSEILALGENILRDCSDYWDRGIAPADHAGEVERILYREPWVQEINPGGEAGWLLLCRTNFIAGRLAKRLDTNGIPWVPVNGYGSKWSAPVKVKAFQALQSLATGHPCSAEEWQAAVSKLPAKHADQQLLATGAKTQWKGYCGDPHELNDLEHLPEWGATPALQQMLKTRSWPDLIDATEFKRVWDTWGCEALLKPKVRIGTIHASKGMEDDNVVLLTTITHQVHRGMEDQAGRDEEARLWYVGATRARKRLLIAEEHDARFRWEMPV